MFDVFLFHYLLVSKYQTAKLKGVLFFFYIWRLESAKLCIEKKSKNFVFFFIYVVDIFFALLYIILIGRLAQLVEQQTLNLWVGSSILPSLITCGSHITVIISAFQAEDEGSTPFCRSKEPWNKI